MTRVRLLLLVLLLFAIGSAQADASEGSRQYRFKQSRITYIDRSAYKPAVAEAVRLWNAAGTPVRLRPTTNARRANLSIVTKPRLFHAGEEVAGLGGGGLVHRGYRTRGRVQLSSAVLGDGTNATTEQINVAAHEIGHALGLSHSPNMCALMNGGAGGPDRCDEFAAVPDGFTRCGPQADDARLLARLYRRTARFPATGGLCKLPVPDLTIVSPPADVVLGPGGGSTSLVVRNDTKRAWNGSEVNVAFTDAAGKLIPNCQGVYLTYSPTESEIPPGGTATFEIYVVCERPPGTSETFHLRVVDEFTQVGKRTPVGPVMSFTVSYTG